MTQEHENQNDDACVRWRTGKKAEVGPNVGYGRMLDKQEREVVYVFRATMNTERRELREWGERS